MQLYQFSISISIDTFLAIVCNPIKIYNYIHHFLFNPLYLFYIWNEWTISHFYRCQTWLFQFLYLMQPTLRSWVAIFHLRPPITFLSHILYDMLGHVPDNGCFILRTRLFNKFLEQNRDISWAAGNSHWGSCMIDTGVLSINMKYPSHEC